MGISIKLCFRPSVIKGKDGTLYYQIIIKRTTHTYTSGYRIYPDEWDKRHSRIVTNSNSLIKIKNRTDWETQQIYAIIKRHIDKGTYLDFGNIISEFEELNRQQSFSDFLLSQAKRLADMGRTRTSETYISALHSFIKFNNNEDIMLYEITAEVMEDYERYLKNRNLTMNSISFYMRTLRTVLNKAVKLHLIESIAPFQSVLHKLKAECGLEKTIDVSVYDVFKNASVYPIIVLGNKVSHEQFNSYFLNNYTDLIDNRLNKKESVEESNKVRLSLLGLKVCSGATGFEAQKIKENICEIDNNHTIPFTVSGNIDRYVFNNTNVRYMKDKYSRAFIYLDSNITESKQEMWKNPKIIIAGMTKKIEACYVDTPLAIGVGVYAIYDFAGYNPFYILGILNSKSTTDFLTAEFSDKHLAGGYLAINKSTIEQFLFPKNVPADVQQHIADIAKSIHLAKKENPKSDIATLESQIDSIVSHLHSI